MDAIFYLRLTLVLVFGIVPALFLSIFAGLGLFSGVSLFLANLSITGLVIVAVSLLGLFGAYSICDAAMGATETWQRFGLFAGIFAAGIFVFIEFSTAQVSARLEPSYWVFSPIIVATLLLLESYMTIRHKDEKTPTTE